MNTILYGPGRTATEGLIAATRIYHKDDPNYPFVYYKDNNSVNPSQFLCFGTPNGQIIYDLVDEAQSLYRNINATEDKTFYDTNINGCYFDLKPTYAKEGKLEIYSVNNPLPTDTSTSGFYLYDEDGNDQGISGKSPYRVGIKLVIKNAFQELNQAIVLYQNVRIRNLYSSELVE